MPRLVRRLLAAAALVAAAVYGGLVLWLVSHETAIVFAPPGELGPRRPAQPFEQVDLPRRDGSRQFAWILRTRTDSDARPWILYLHGNSSTIAQRLNIVHYERLREIGLNVFAPEYRGFGGLDGVPTERSLALDARAAYDYVRSALHVTPDRLVIYGWSLGSAVAVELAAQVDESSVILEGAPASLVAIGERRYPLIPIRLVMRNPFESISRIGAIDSPLLMLHSPEDEIIPFDEGQRLYRAAPPPKQFAEVSGGHIYASERDPRFFGYIREFLSTQHILP
jgi:fermentation-respiration switch protein FrsA (DUF1100 family)